MQVGTSRSEPSNGGVGGVKVILQRTFFQQTNGLCTCIIKIVIIFLNKEAILLKKNFCQYFVL